MNGSRRFQYKILKESDIWALACVAIEIYNEDIPYPQFKQLKEVQEFVIQGGIPQFSDEIKKEELLVQLLLKSFSYQADQRPIINEFRQIIETIKKKYEQDLQINVLQESFDNASTAQNKTSQQITQISNLSHTQEIMSMQGEKIISISQESFLKDSNTILTKKGLKFQEIGLNNSGINMDRGSSVYYAADYICVSGGYSQKCCRNFQIIKRNPFQIEVQCEMISSRNGHGMIPLTQKDNLFMFLISGNVTDQQDQDQCEYYDRKDNVCKKFFNIVFSGKNFGCILDGQSILVLGGESTQFTKMCYSQQFDFELNMWKLLPICIPIGSSVNIIKNGGITYMFGDFLQGFYQIKKSEDNIQFLLLSKEAYPGQPCNQSPIIVDEKIYVYDGKKIYYYEITNKLWKEGYSEEALK